MDHLSKLWGQVLMFPHVPRSKPNMSLIDVAFSNVPQQLYKTLLFRRLNWFLEEGGQKGPNQTWTQTLNWTFLNHDAQKHLNNLETKKKLLLYVHISLVREPDKTYATSKSLCLLSFVFEVADPLCPTFHQQVVFCICICIWVGRSSLSHLSQEQYHNNFC